MTEVQSFLVTNFLFVKMCCQKYVIMAQIVHRRDRAQSWLVGCFGLNGPLRQYFSLYRAVSQREGERKEK